MVDESAAGGVVFHGKDTEHAQAVAGQRLVDVLNRVFHGQGRGENISPSGPIVEFVQRRVGRHSRGRGQQRDAALAERHTLVEIGRGNRDDACSRRQEDRRTAHRHHRVARRDPGRFAVQRDQRAAVDLLDAGRALERILEHGLLRVSVVLKHSGFAHHGGGGRQQVALLQRLDAAQVAAPRRRLPFSAGIVARSAPRRLEAERGTATASRVCRAQTMESAHNGPLPTPLAAIVQDAWTLR